MGVAGNSSRWMRRSSSCPDKSRKWPDTRYAQETTRGASMKENIAMYFFTWCVKKQLDRFKDIQVFVANDGRFRRGFKVTDELQHIRSNRKNISLHIPSFT